MVSSRREKLQAAFELQREMRERHRILRQGKDVVLKVGVHERPKEVAALIRRLVDGGGEPW